MYLSQDFFEIALSVSETKVTRGRLKLCCTTS